MLTSCIDLLTEAVSIPSVNPAHGDDPSVCGESRMADWLRARLEERGLTVESLNPMGPDRPAVVGRNQPAHPVRSLMIEIHLDTVGVSGMTVDPFAGTVQAGRLYGRGSCDMKGSTCAFLTALTPERIQSLTDRNIQLLVVGAPDEETGLTGSQRLVEQGLRADDAVILEPTRCMPVIAHKGAFWYEVVLNGRAGHGSQPEKGTSTHQALAEFLPELYRIHQEEATKHVHPLLGSSTLNIGRIDGGRTFNVIPDHTRLELDRRVVAGEDPEAFAGRVHEVIVDMAHKKQLTGGHISCVSKTPPFQTDPESVLVQLLRSAIDGDSTPSGTSWVSDASMFSTVCGNTVVFGPGDITQAHTVDEYIELEQLETGIGVFARFLDAYGTDDV
jgi:acetylornithine deacetylase/succinyl-diaminopimelate desuccinylase-like protein